MWPLQSNNHIGVSGRFQYCLWRVLLFILPLTATAQPRDTIKGKPLRPVTVAGTPVAPLSTTPTQQLNAAEFVKYSAFNVADAVRNFTGVVIRDYGGIGGIKTISVRSLGAEHTAVLYDGIQLNDVQNGQIDLSKFNLQNVARVALYVPQPPEICMPARNFATASVLAINPVRPQLELQKPYQITAGLKSGSFGSVNPYLQWQQRLNRNWALNLNTNVQSANGRYRFKTSGTGMDTLATRTNAGIKSLSVDAALYYAKTDSNRFTIRLNEYAVDQELPGAVILYAQTGRQHIWGNNIFSQATYNRIWHSGWQLLINTKLSSDYLHYLNPQVLNTLGKTEQFYNQREVYQSAAVSYNVAHNWQVSYAADIAYGTLTVSSVVPEGRRVNPLEPSRFTLFNVLASKFSIGKWLLQGSLLHTYVNDQVQAGTALPAKALFTPTLQAAVKPFDQNFQLRAFYKYSFRYPTFNDLYYSEIDQPRSLKPEYARQYDIGADYTKAFNGWVDQLHIASDIYYNKVTDKIVAIPRLNAFIWAIQNLGKVDVRGITASAEAQSKPVNHMVFRLSGSYTYQQALDVTNPRDSYYNSQIPYTPRQVWSYNAGISYCRLGVYFNQLFSSERYYVSSANPEFLLPRYAVSDVSANYNFRLSGHHMQLTGEINNLLNTQYTVIRSFPMPGTSVRFTLQFTI